VLDGDLDDLMMAYLKFYKTGRLWRDSDS
jgi:peptide chain release factor 2